MSSIKHAVISAAGIGSRLGLNRPKCLIDIAGRSLLDYHIERLSWVETVWLVVGFQEEEVMAHALALRNDIIIVRNPEYASTNTLQSIHRVSRHLKERMLVLDADTVIENASFARFVAAAERHESLIGVSSYTTSDGVRTLLDQDAVTGFTREPHHCHEWTGIAVIKPEIITDEPIYVYQALERFLPMPACDVKAFDIDTSADLDMARRVIANNWK
ncbi:MAG: NTP transferase domain-containing protein [Moraxellaceae bacterium]|nr:NTP transferase domain-containing protein [Moraxellaceae bacterium]